MAIRKVFSTVRSKALPGSRSMKRLAAAVLTFLAAVHAYADIPAGDCDAGRSTPQAPEAYWFRENPLDASRQNLAAGKRLYEAEARPIPCASCHGIAGKGDGEMSGKLVPKPTNFTCRERMRALTDGHIFWLVEQGSGVYSLLPGHLREGTRRPGRRPRYTAMRGHRNDLTDNQIWQLVLYIRTLDGGHGEPASASAESGR